MWELTLENYCRAFCKCAQNMDQFLALDLQQQRIKLGMVSWSFPVSTVNPQPTDKPAVNWTDWEHTDTDWETEPDWGMQDRQILGCARANVRCIRPPVRARPQTLQCFCEVKGIRRGPAVRIMVPQRLPVLP